jgi:hypothetical protein
MTYFVSDVYPKGIRKSAETLFLTSSTIFRQTVTSPKSLYTAVQEGNARNVDFLIGRGADVNSPLPCTLFTP